MSILLVIFHRLLTFFKKISLKIRICRSTFQQFIPGQPIPDIFIDFYCRNGSSKHKYFNIESFNASNTKIRKVLIFFSAALFNRKRKSKKLSETTLIDKKQSNYFWSGVNFGLEKIFLKSWHSHDIMRIEN